MLLYIDPGTGSMLFTVLLGLVTTLFFFLQKLFIRLRFKLSAGKVDKAALARHPYVIFSDSGNYWNVFRPICDEFERRQIPVMYWTASEKDPGLKAGYHYVKAEYIGEGNKAFSRLNLMSADIVLATTPGLDVLQWKRSKNVRYYVHILHAAGTSAGGYRMFSLDYYDAVLLTGDFQIREIRELEEKRHLPAKDIRVVGCTYMDVLKERLEKRKAQEASKQPLSSAKAEKQMTVLLAPSWGTSSLLVRYGEKILDSLLATGFRLIIRPHPQSFISDKAVMDALRAKYPDSDGLRWDPDPDNFNSLYESDIMISDFSSVMFDYALVFNKPFIYAESAFDKAPYEAAWLDEELWKFRVLPSIGLPLQEAQFPDLKRVIEEAVQDGHLAGGRDAAREEAWAHIGESARLTVDYLTARREELTAGKA